MWCCKSPWYFVCDVQHICPCTSHRCYRNYKWMVIIFIFSIFVTKEKPFSSTSTLSFPSVASLIVLLLISFSLSSNHSAFSINFFLISAIQNVLIRLVVVGGLTFQLHPPLLLHCCSIASTINMLKLSGSSTSRKLKISTRHSKGISIFFCSQTLAKV